nr:type II CAAX endopeptidase family protein [Cryptosporangium phraense]
MMIYRAPSTPYHHLARTATNRWWKTALGFLLAPALYFLVVLVAVAAATLFGISDVSPVTELALTLGSIVLFLPVVLLTAWWTQGRRPGTLSSVRGQLRVRWMLGCAAVALAFTIVSFVVLALLPGSGTPYEWAGWATFVPALMVIVVLVPLQAAAEEYLCRGWILQSIGAFTRSPWLAVGVQAVVFALLHGIGTPWGFADLVVFAAVAGWLAVRTGGLEAGIALHAINNLLAFTLTASAAGGLTDDTTAADAGWAVAVVDIAVVVAYGLVVRWLARRFRVGAERLVPLAVVSRREVPTARGPVLTSRSSRDDVSSSCGR